MWHPFSSLGRHESGFATSSEQSSTRLVALPSLLLDHPLSPSPLHHDHEESFAAPITIERGRPRTYPSSSPPSSIRAARQRYVTSACMKCKQSHLRCDQKRPCERCCKTGDQDTCLDVEQKKRGRRRREERSERRERREIARATHYETAARTRYVPYRRTKRGSRNGGSGVSPSPQSQECGPPASHTPLDDRGTLPHLANYPLIAKTAEKQRQGRHTAYTSASDDTQGANRDVGHAPYDAHSDETSQSKPPYEHYFIATKSSLGFYETTHSAASDPIKSHAFQRLDSQSQSRPKHLHRSMANNATQSRVSVATRAKQTRESRLSIRPFKINNAPSSMPGQCENISTRSDTAVRSASNVMGAVSSMQQQQHTLLNATSRRLPVLEPSAEPPPFVLPIPTAQTLSNTGLKLPPILRH